MKNEFSKYDPYVRHKVSDLMDYYCCNSAEIDISDEIVDYLVKLDSEKYKYEVQNKEITPKMLKKATTGILYNILGNDFDYGVNRKKIFIRKCKVSKIPFRYKRDKTNKNIYAFIVQNDNINKKEEYYVQRIELPKKITYDMIPVCIHEMIHALLNRNKGSFSNYANEEILSMFMEYVSLEEMDKIIPNSNEEIKKQAQNMIVLNRFRAAIKYMQLSDVFIKTKERNDKKDWSFASYNKFPKIREENKISEFDKKNINRYVVNDVFTHCQGYIYAYEMYNKYRNGTTEDKTNFISDVKKCLSGDTTVEELLEQYEIIPNIETVKKMHEEADKILARTKAINKDFDRCDEK